MSSVPLELETASFSLLDKARDTLLDELLDSAELPSKTVSLEFNA